jgi:ribonuclease-3
MKGGAPLSELTAALGHEFADPKLLREALAHPSTSATGRSYERLEFLGDRVLGLVVADLLMRRFPGEDEGDLARRFAALVSRDGLLAVARSLDLGRYLSLARGEEESGGRENPAILADACEAVIGALYLDGGFEAARRFVSAHWTSRIEADLAPPQDAKTALQEWAQAARKPLPVYRTTGTDGPSHEPVFHVEVEVEGYPPASASGPSKRAAERAAAAALLARLTRHAG